jgi:hypothetical protein
MSESIREEALGWHQAGWSIIPIKMQEKKAAVRWKRYQRKRAVYSTVCRWFKEDQYGLGVIFGSVSGNLAAMDFDKLPAFSQWAAEHPQLAATLPIVETRRGRHVYFQTTPESVSGIRRTLGKSLDGTGHISLPAGELKLGTGTYTVLPPSQHPSGFQYRWIRKPELPLPIVDPAVFLTCNREDGEYREAQREQKTYRGGECERACAENESEIIQRAIKRTLPTGYGQRHRSIFNLARELKACLPDAPYSDLKPIVREWHQQAAPNIHTKPFEDSWFDFAESWQKVMFPAGEEPIQMIVKKALGSDLPKIAGDYESPEVQALIAICRELQRAAGDGAFYLACRTAGRILDIDHTSANRYLRGLCIDEVIQLVSKGSQSSKKANRYRYLHEL